MRVTARLHGYPPAHNAGAEWHAASLMTALARRGHQAEVHLTRTWPPHMQPWELDGVRVLPDGTWTPLPRPDVYVTHLENVRPVASLARGTGTPLAVVMHNTRWLEIADLMAADPALTVLNSEWMAGRIAAPHASVIVRPPVDPARYETTSGDKVTIISLTEGKGGHLFWQLAAAMPGTQFLAVRGSYGVQVIPDVIPPNVTLAGPFDGRDMRDQVYARTRILLVPSDYESWGRVASEAMCSGIPVIAHRAEGGLAENLGDAAVWADRDDPGTWVSQIRRLGKPAAWVKASEAALKRSAELDPAGDLERWCQAVEALAP
jgi:hypothetical protein